MLKTLMMLFITMEGFGQLEQKEYWFGISESRVRNLLSLLFF